MSPVSQWEGCVLCCGSIVQAVVVKKKQSQKVKLPMCQLVYVPTIIYCHKRWVVKEWDHRYNELKWPSFRECHPHTGLEPGDLERDQSRAAEVVWASGEEPPYGDFGPDPEHAAYTLGMLCLWPGNDLGSHRRSWRTVQGWGCLGYLTQSDASLTWYKSKNTTCRILNHIFILYLTADGYCMDHNAK